MFLQNNRLHCLVMWFLLCRSPSKAQQRNPPLPPRHDVSKQAKKKGSKDDGDNFDEEPLFPKYENIFHFAPKEKKTSPPSGSSVPEGKPPLQSSSVPAAGGRTNADLDTSAPAYQDEVHRLRLVVDCFLYKECIHMHTWKQLYSHGKVKMDITCAPHTHAHAHTHTHNV